MYDTYTPTIPEFSFDEFFSRFRSSWQQGEHVALVGQTGRGKTSLARDILEIRDWVIGIDIKRKDSSVDLFKDAGYKILEYRPVFGLTIPYNVQHCVIRMKPKNLRDTSQSQRVYQIMDKVFLSGGWCLYLDDTGYVTGTLGLKRPLVVLLSQARSNGSSVVTAMVQPTSLTQGVPTEAFKQVRHVMAWKYVDDPSIESIGRLGGVNKKIVHTCMDLLGDHDFLYIHDGSVTVVRNTH